MQRSLRTCGILCCACLLALWTSRFLFALDTPVEEKPSHLFESEVVNLQRLIEVNEKRLLTQKTLHENMRLLQDQKKDFVGGNQTKSHTFNMVSNARKILVVIKEENLSYLFGSEYLEELLFFSSLATKSAPMKP